MGLFRPQNLIGIDIGSHSLKIVKLKGKAGSYTLDGAASMKIQPEQSVETSVAKAISEIISSRHIHGRKAATVITGPSLTFRHLNLPEMPPSDLKEAVNWEIRKEVKYSSDNFVADYVLTGEEVSTERSRKVSLIAFASKKSDIEALLELLEKAELDLRAIEAAPTALLAAFDLSNFWEEDVNYAMIDMGHNHSTLTVFKNRRLKFVRDIPFGGRELTVVLASGLVKSDEQAEADKITYGIVGGDDETAEKIKELLTHPIEALSAELSRSFDYYQARFQESEISKVFLCGGTSMLRGLDDRLSELLGMQCFLDDPMRSISISNGIDMNRLKSISPSLTLATGLATRTDRND